MPSERRARAVKSETFAMNSIAGNKIEREHDCITAFKTG
jgi:hypothetical protein